MRYFMLSRDPRYVEAYKELRAAASARIRFFQEKARALGFDEIGAEVFGFPGNFFKRVGDNDLQRGPAIDGFKGGKRVNTEQGAFFHYTLHGRNARATELMKAFQGAPDVPEEMKGRLYAIRRDISTAFCLRFGLPTNVWTGNAIAFGSVHLLSEELVACNLPYRDDNSKEAAPPVFPAGFEEVTERAFIAAIDAHNRALEGAAV